MENQRHRVNIKRPAFRFHTDGKVFLFIFGKYLNIVELCQILLVKPARRVHGTRLHSLYSSPALSLWADTKHSPSPDQAYFASQKEGTLCLKGWALGIDTQLNLALPTSEVPIYFCFSITCHQRIAPPKCTDTTACLHQGPIRSAISPRLNKPWNKFT